ncbi:unnamed protein product [Sympodiomycopsis kandeliae]
MSATYTPASPSSVGLGRPSSGPMGDNRPETLTASLSLSSLASSSSVNSLSPLPLSRSHYSTAAHHFIQRQPQKALIALQDARRLCFKVISHDDTELRKNSVWVTLREKIAILWITLLVSFAKKEHGSDVSNIYDQLPKETVELLQASGQPNVFLPRLVTEVLAAWAADASEEAVIRNAKDEHHSQVRHRLLGAVPAAVAASLIMANLSIEEAAGSTSSSSGSSSSTTAKGQTHQPSPNAHPLAREISEEFLSSQSARLDVEQTDSVLAAYSRVLELYSIHVLGVRCDQWDYADQLIRLSLLQDEPRAKLLLTLQRAQTHISTRPQRRASALLAQQKAYEAEKQRRASNSASEAKAKAKVEEGLNTTTSATARRQAGNGTKLRRSSSSSSAPTSESEAESQPGSTVNRSSRDRQSKTGFAATRAHLSDTIARHHERDERDSAETVSSTNTNAVSSRTTSRDLSSGSTSTIIQRYLTYLRSRSGMSAVISILAPLSVLIFSMRRLTLGRTRAVGGSGGSAGRTGGGDDQGVLRKVIGSILGTLKMGTQVTYL